MSESKVDAGTGGSIDALTEFDVSVILSSLAIDSAVNDEQYTRYARLLRAAWLTRRDQPPENAQQAEEAVYHAYVAARQLRLQHIVEHEAFDTVLTGLRAARRFIFNSYALPAQNEQNWAGHPDTALTRRDALQEQHEEPLHTGDDERLDLLTGLRAGLEALRDDRHDTDLDETIESSLEDLDRLDELIIATIHCERLGRDAEPWQPIEHQPPAVHHFCGVSNLGSPLACWCRHIRTVVDGAAQQDEYECTACGAEICTNINEWRKPDAIQLAACQDSRK